MEFGKINRIQLRDVWRNEAIDFTPWLSQNINVIGEALGLELELIEREASTGDFSLDLLAKDLGSNRKVVIENQIEKTDHDHLGKLLTYASGFNAGVVVWIAESLRDEHRQALEWLNQRTTEGTDFFGLSVEVFRIDDSNPAYRFNPIVFPNEWSKQKQTPKSGATSQRSEAYRAFFQGLIDELREKYKFTNARAGQPQNWYSFASGVSGITYGTSFGRDNLVKAEIYIDVNDQERNKEIFDSLYSNKDNYEQQFGDNLEWERMDDKQASRIAIYRNGSIEMSSEELEEVKEWAIDYMLKLKDVFGKRIRELNNK